LEKRYGRAQFLRDALSLGLPTHLAFSRTALRRRRDRLIREHHPDRGGNNEKAQEVNEIYGRMSKWLDARYKPGSRQAEASLDEPEGETVPGKHSRLIKKAAAVALWTVTMIVSTYVASRKSKRS
jgi:hypothetical protein